MISLTRINGDSFVLNADLIEHIETTPDSVITLTTGQKIMVREPVGEITERVIQFRRAIHGGGPAVIPIRRYGQSE